MKKIATASGLAAFAVVLVSTLTSFAQVSQTPPMGWASYDCLNFTATEAEMKAMADSMAKKYASYGWQYVNIDWCWSFPCPGITNCTQGSPNQTWVNGQDGNPDAATRLKMDAYGRLMPDTVRHPSAVGGAGFKPLADYIHGKGLKFGIHVMRGIPRQAVYANTPIYGTTYHAADAANKNENCPWLNHMYGLNFGSPAAQAYLNSILTMYAAWGIDYIKIDDLVNANVSPRTTFKTYIQGYRAAIDSTHRPIVFSTSPGATPIGDSVFFMTYTNQWRMADDLWDNWNSLNNMIGLFANWYHCAYAPHYPDADMIPIGYLSERGPNGGVRYSNLTRAEQFTMMTMWYIGRSPLIWGGDLRNNRLAEDSLMTNAEVIAVNQRGKNPRPVGATGGTNYPVWVSDHPDSSNVKYIAMVNRSGATYTVTLTLSSIGFTTCTARNLWTKTNLGSFTTTFAQSLATHASGLYKLTGPGTSVSTTFFPGKAMTPQEMTFRCTGETFVFPAGYGGKTISMAVYDLGGKLVKSSTFSNRKSVDLKKDMGIPTGSYIVKMATR
jgi:alpha-galactosidase